MFRLRKFYTINSAHQGKDKHRVHSTENLIFLVFLFTNMYALCTFHISTRKWKTLSMLEQIERWYPNDARVRQKYCKGH